MSDKKILAIDPKMFTFSDNNSTRKKRDKPETQSKIKMKTVNRPVKNTSLKKRSIINMMRKHQETKYKEKFDDVSKKKNKEDTLTFRNDFDNATEYFKNLQENITKNTVSPKNHTLKQYPSTSSYTPHTSSVMPSLHIDSLQNIAGNISANPALSSTTINTNVMPAPKYGCLKNGTLPTFRNLMNQTRKNTQESVIGGGVSSVTSEKNASVNTDSVHVPTSGISQHLKTAIQSNNVRTKLENEKRSKLKQKRLKRKKTIRRTYKIGRSKIMPKVSVLISNKTIRNNISTKTHTIKQTPLHEVRKYLVKHGFIRVGAVTPTDVLRKMYECAMLMCGEIQNHNPDNLLYNFMHDVDK